MSDAFVAAMAWLAVLAMAISAVLFGQESRTAPRRPLDARRARRRRFGVAVSISGPIAVVLVSLAVAAMTAAWLIVAVLAFAGVAVVAAAGLATTPH